MPTLDAEKQLISDLWLDQPDALARIDARVAAGTLSVDDAAKLRDFTTKGFLTLSIDIDDSFVQAFDADVERQWRERPADLAVTAKSGEKTAFHDFDDDAGRGYRIPDLHSHSTRALDLYLHPDIFRVVELVFGQPAVAIQSLYFRQGSEQALHRDPMFVTAKPASHLVASWIALEDITIESGPLLYAPGSHRMPWYEFEEDTIAMPWKNRTVEVQRRWAQWRDQQVEMMGVEPTAFTCKRGDVFIWHGALLHGGAPMTDSESTRKSFVVHYSTAANYRSRSASMRRRVEVDGTAQWGTINCFTERVLECNGYRGIDNPLRGTELTTTPDAAPQGRARASVRRPVHRLRRQAHRVRAGLRRLARSRK